jgi:NAD(P)-dependent dehydrogenase (short-subunit alcohol dehydrogenase family)
MDVRRSTVDGPVIADLAGRVGLVTGANRGIGLATSIELARAGAHVIVACRDPGRAKVATHRIKQDVAGASVESVTVDLASAASVRQAAARVRERFGALDVLVNNAATVSEHRQVTMDGRELTFAVNHLAYFLLTRLLLDTLRAANDPVVVNVAATNHRDATDPEDLDSVRGYEMRAAYKRSKLANVSFTRELARRAAGAVRVHAFCPDVVATELLMQFRRVPPAQWNEKLAVESPPRSAASVAMSLVRHPGSGRYLEEGVEVTPSPLACDEAYGQWLWRRCSEFTGLPVD